MPIVLLKVDRFLSEQQMLRRHVLYLGVEIYGVSWALPSEHSVETLFP
jgi:hypothetical protein